MSSLIACDVTQASVSARTTSLLSTMTSWITAALLMTEPALNRPQTMLDGAAAAAAGPGLDLTPPSKSSSATSAAGGERGERSRCWWRG